MAEFVHGSRNGTDLLSVSGEVDIASVDDFLAAARSRLENAPVLEIDLGSVSFIDSSGLGALVRLHKESEEAGKELRLANVPGSMRRLLEITGLDDLFGLGTGE